MIGCYVDIGEREVWFSRNGAVVPGVLRLPHLDDVITPAISMSSSVRYMCVHSMCKYSIYH